LGYLTRFLILKFTNKKTFEGLRPRFAGVATLGVLGIVYVAIALKSSQILSHPQELFFMLIPLCILYLFNFILSTIVGKFLLSRGEAIALVYSRIRK